jgi:hypothetical protein
MRARPAILVITVSILMLAIYSSSINLVTAKFEPSGDEVFACSSSHSTPNVVKCTFTLDGKSTGYNCMVNPTQKLSCVNDTGTGTETLAKGNMNKKFHDLLMQLIALLR